MSPDHVLHGRINVLRSSEYIVTFDSQRIQPHVGDPTFLHRKVLLLVSRATDPHITI